MCFRCSKEPSHWDWKVLENKMPWNVLKNLSKVLKNLWILLFSMVWVCYYSGFTHWQYLNIEGFLEESLKSNLPWNMLDNLSKALRSSCILLLSMGLVCYYSGLHSTWIWRAYLKCPWNLICSEICRIIFHGPWEVLASYCYQWV